MINIVELLNYNKKFVERKEYEYLKTSKYPNKKIAILSCMDTRLTELLQKSMNIENGDAIIIKNAGAVISHPFGSIMRSILISIYNLNATEIFIVGHTDCGMESLNAEDFIQKMIERKISPKDIELVNYCGFDLKKWLKGFENSRTSVLEAVNTIKNHPLIPKDVQVLGFLMNPNTGELHFLDKSVEVV